MKKLLFLVLLVVAVSAAAAETTTRLEIAPNDIGQFSSEGFVILAGDSSGKSIFLFEADSGRLHEFSEGGKKRGKTIQAMTPSGPLSLQSPAEVAVGTSEVAVASPLKGLTTFARGSGAFKGTTPMMLAGDIIPRDGGWFVSLQNLPIGGNDRFLGRSEEAEDGVPRLASLDRKLETRHLGLKQFDDELPGNASVGIGRRLYLATVDDRLFAAELSNYRIFELDLSLDVKAQFSDPAMFLEGGVMTQEEKTAADQEFLEVHGKATTTQGVDATKPVSSRSVSGGALDYAKTIVDIAWDPREQVLVVLLGADIVGGSGALDLIDVSSGSIRRIPIDVSAKDQGGAAITHLVIGYDYYWFRSRGAKAPTYRLDRTALVDKGEQLAFPEGQRFNAD